MGKEITFFPSYSTKENRATNYTMLVFKMLYEFDTNLFKEFFISIAGDEIGSKIGLVFKQQEKKESSIPDGLISQVGILGYIESKVGKSFNCNQINSHLESLKNAKNVSFKFLVLLGNLEKNENSLIENCNIENDKSISIIFTSYNDILASLKNIIDKYNSKLPFFWENLIDEYEIFLDTEDLLPNWENILDVVSCSGSYDEVNKFNIYVCPNEGSSYSHKRAKYFGAYTDKNIKLVSEIEAIIKFDENEESKVKWINSDRKKNEIIDDAIKRFNKSKNLKPKDCQIFLLKDPFNVNFIKDSPGGMQHSKYYVNIKNANLKNSKLLAEYVNNKKQSDVIKIVDGKFTIL